jgi:hypothetical protein
MRSVIAVGVVAVVIVLAALLLLAAGHSTGDSGQGTASAFTSLLGTGSAMAAGPRVAPAYPGTSEDGGAGEGTAAGAPPPDEVDEDDSGAEVNDDGTPPPSPPEPALVQPAVEPVVQPVVERAAEPVVEPVVERVVEPTRVGYCDAQGKFYELTVDQYKTEPWSAKGPWTDAYRDPETGAVSCDFPRKEPEAPASEPAVPDRLGYVTINTPGYDGSTSFRVNIYIRENGVKTSQQRRVRNNETITFTLPPGATSRVKFNGAKCAGWSLKGTTPSALHWEYEATHATPSDDPKCEEAP